MLYTIAFTKASGAGNDFVIVDDRTEGLPADKPRLASVLCSRHFGIGADGLLILQPSSVADYTMLYYNADGSSGGMCGNGGRCIARFAALHGIAPADQTFEALGYIYRAQVRGATVRLAMKEPTDIRIRFPLETPAEHLTAHSVNTGAPHVVVFDQSLETRDVDRTGRSIAHHAEFSPEGTNVNFVRVLEDGKVAMRTYERGVEAETLACGTGSVACAIVASLVQGLVSPVRVRTSSGEDLLVEFMYEGGTFRKIVLSGSAHMLFSGEVRYDEPLGRLSESTRDVPASSERP